MNRSRRLFLWIGLLWLLLAAASLAMSRGQSPAADDMGAVFTDVACNGPCFLGIMLEQTTLADARARLLASDWIAWVEPTTRMDYYGAEHLPFGWHSPADTGEGWDGELVANYGVIYLIRLEMAVPLGEIWRALGQPAFTVYSATPRRRAPTAQFYAMLDDENGVFLSGEIDCPLRARGWLNGEARTLELRRRPSLVISQRAANPAQMLHYLRADTPLC